MTAIRRALLDLREDAASVFAVRRLPWHLLAVAITVICVHSGLDGWVAATFRDSELRAFTRLAGRVGKWTPIVVPLAILLVGTVTRHRVTVTRGGRLAEAEVLAVAICAAYKTVTGRPGPTQFDVADVAAASHVFRFGFLRGGVYWGWPSSHVMVAVAGAVALTLLCRERRWVGIVAILYAAWMTASVSISFHWFSDAVAAVVIGIVIGRVVGRDGTISRA